MSIMNQKVKSGTTVTARAFSKNQSSVYHKRPNQNDFQQPILKAISFGVNAPNPHNTQAWKMKILSDEQMLLYIDENRLLPATDPPARQIHIGSGCFIEMLRIGMSSIGYDTQVELLPEGEYIYEEIGNKPVARIKVSRNSQIKESPLYPYTYLRQSSRKVYTGPFVTNQEFEEIKNLVGESHPEIIILNKPEEMQPYMEIFQEAMRIEMDTSKPLWDETRVWMRWNESDRETKRDGLSVPQAGTDGLKKVLMEAYLNRGNEKRWFSSRTIKSSLKDYKKGLDSSKGIVFFKTKTNTMHDWLETGFSYCRYHLAATKFNFYLHPYSQVLQEYEEMQELQELFNERMEVSGDEKVQMAVRICRSKKPYFTYRRKTKNYIVE
jgi:hypothetical protein